jgi:hypothetical protein
MAIFDNVWAYSGDVEAPDDARFAAGFTCGKASPQIINWLFQTLMQAINAVGDLGAMVPQSRQVNTTEGLQGGGTLETDRTLRLNIPGLDAVADINGTDLIVLFRGEQHYKITRSAFVAGLGGEGGSIILGGANIGGGPGNVYSGVDTDTMEFRTIDAGTGIAVATSGDKVIVSFDDFEVLTVN